MRCLVTGAYGFIGQEIVAALRRQGWTVVGAGRDIGLGARIVPDIDWIACDFNRDVEVAVWLPRLKGIDAVVNCVGILQSGLGDDAETIHGAATIALFEACAATGVKRLIHVSAISADTEMATDYARSKAKADASLAKLGVNWLIVKPSLVIGRGSFGGTSLLRGLAGLPGVLPVPGLGAERFQPIALDDLADGLARLLSREAPSRVTLYAVGPEAVSTREILRAYRTWLGFPKAREIAVPLPLLKVLLKLGDMAGWIGHASPLRTTSLTQMRHDKLADGAAFAAASCVALKSFQETLRATPATLQDRLHARSFFLVPLLHFVLAAFWILSGLIALTPRGFGSAVSFLAGIGIAPGLTGALVRSGAVADILFGVLFLLPRFVRPAGASQLLLSAAYLAALTYLAPSLWADPFGPLLKVLPIMAATALVMAYQEKR